MEEFQTWINQVKQTNMNAEIPMEMVNSLKEVIQDSAPSVTVEIMCQQVDELYRGIQDDRQASYNLRSLVIDLQEKLDVMPSQTTGSIIFSPKDCSPQVGDEQSWEGRSSCTNSSSREREIVWKGIERLEKQILQLMGVFISPDQVNIPLLKKWKTVDVPAVNSAFGNVQKALQKYVGFVGMDSDYCDRTGELKDKAQA